VNVKELDQFGWIKFDLLGLDTLRIVEKSIELIIERRRREHGWFEVVTDEGTTMAYGDQRVVTRNRGTVLVNELVQGDDVISIERPKEDAIGTATA
jgi:two-component sensor histidine kinase